MDICLEVLLRSIARKHCTFQYQSSDKRLLQKIKIKRNHDTTAVLEFIQTLSIELKIIILASFSKITVLNIK